MAIIVSDFRDKSKYYLFHSDLANKLEDIGFEMKGLKVLYQRHKSVFPYGYPYAYVPNIHNHTLYSPQNPLSPKYYEHFLILKKSRFYMPFNFSKYLLIHINKYLGCEIYPFI